jgi:alkylation response protein AidB-like acyl-CoA dehydrogenase
MTDAAPRPLTALTEDEKLFQATVRKFAREEIRPHVRAMDEAGVFRKDLIRQFFDMGLMGIEIPEEYGGQGGSFFQAILAVDPSAGVIVDVQNTICNNALLRWASAEQKRRFLPRLAADTVASYHQRGRSRILYSSPTPIPKRATRASPPSSSSAISQHPYCGSD